MDATEQEPPILKNSPKIPGYTVLSRLGSGGMATVYLAIQESFGRKVALKVMASTSQDDNSYADRFLREAKIVARLSHPHIVPVYDVGTANGSYYISMEYLDSGDLSSKIRQGLTLRQILKITKDVALALDYAHRKGIIHRDVKPDNIMFREDNIAVLTDFGIARPADPDSNMTQVGKVIGTPKYMSPEQTKGDPLDNTCDIYALGIMLYEMLTGNVPFNGSNPFEIGIKHLKDPVPQMKPSLRIFQELIDKLLAKNKTLRVQTGQEVIGYLEEIEKKLADSANAKATVSKPSSSRNNNKTQKIETSPSMRAESSDRKNTQAAKEKQKLSASFFILTTLLLVLSAVATVWYVPSFAPDNKLLMKAHRKLVVILQPQNAAPIIETINTSSNTSDTKAIQKSLDEAKIAITLGNYATPKGDSALDHYRTALSIDAGNLDAKSGIANIANQLLTQANEAIESGNLEKAESLIKITNSISENIPGLNAAEIRLQQKQQAIRDAAKQAELEKRLREEKLQQQKAEAIKQKVQVATTKPATPKSTIAAEVKTNENKPNALLNKVRINGLLGKADTYFSRGDYHTPTQESALGKYLEVLSIDSSNAQARQGIDKVVNVIITEIQDKLLAQEFSSAQTLYNKGIQAAPDNTQLKTLGRSKGW